MVFSYWSTINKYVFSYIFYYAVSSNYAVLFTLLITVFLYIGDEFYIELKLRLFINFNNFVLLHMIWIGIFRFINDYLYFLIIEINIMEIYIF